jgi:hypothetical protein
MMTDRVLSREELFRLFLKALADKKPESFTGWTAAELDEEIYKATREYEPDPLLRQADALQTAVFCLTDFARRMPERVDLSENTARVREMCLDLAAEIERITLRPDEVIAERGKLKVRLKAILSIRTCLIYREETERFINERGRDEQEARLAEMRARQLKEKEIGALAERILKNAREKSNVQPGLF